MSALSPDPTVSLVTIPNVELVQVGDWEASTGPCTFTTEHLAAAVDALSDPAVKAPRLRIGHTDPSAGIVESAGGFADQPAFGRFVNLRLADNGTKIVADIAGVPAWLAEILPAAFPSRSVEAFFNVTTAAGRKHDMVISSVALLGVSMPAVETLDDLLLAFGAEAPDGLQLQFSGDRVAATRGGAMPERVSASVTYTDVRRSFYEDFATEESGRYWWWCADMILAPPTVIADDDEGGLWSVPYSLKGDTITWGDPVEVRIQYVEVDGGKVAASRAAAAGEHAFASAGDSRPKDRVRAASKPKEDEMADDAKKTLRETLGLAETATQDEVDAAALEALAKNDPAPEGDPPVEDTPAAPAAADPPVPVAASGVTVDAETWAQTRKDAEDGRVARAEQVSASRRDFVDKAIKAGKFPPSRRDHYLALMERDDAGTREFVNNKLEAGSIPLEERGGSPAPVEASEAAQLERVCAALGLATA